MGKKKLCQWVEKYNPQLFFATDFFLSQKKNHEFHQLLTGKKKSRISSIICRKIENFINLSLKNNSRFCKLVVWKNIAKFVDWSLIIICKFLQLYAKKKKSFKFCQFVAEKIAHSVSYPREEKEFCQSVTV